MLILKIRMIKEMIKTMIIICMMVRRSTKLNDNNQFLDKDIIFNDIMNMNVVVVGFRNSNYANLFFIMLKCVVRYYCYSTRLEYTCYRDSKN